MLSERHPAKLGYSRLDEARQPSQPTSATTDPSGLIGNWTNADPETRCLQGVRVAAQAGILSVGLDPAFGRPDETPTCPAIGYVERADASAFAAITAGGTRGGLDLRLEGNLNAGLLVLCCYKTWRDAGRSGCFSREYFSKRAASGTATGGDSLDPVEDPLFHGVDLPERLSPEALLGHWSNPDRHSRGLCDLWISPCAEDVVVSAVAHGHIVWGEATGRLYTDVVDGNAGGVAASARFDFGFVESTLQIREVKGVLVVASFARFETRAQRDPHFIREFFYRPGS